MSAEASALALYNTFDKDREYAKKDRENDKFVEEMVAQYQYSMSLLGRAKKPQWHYDAGTGQWIEK